MPKVINKDYAIYNLNDEILMVGSLRECAKYIGIRYNSIIRKKNDQHKKSKLRKYLIVEIEDDWIRIC